MDLGDMSRKLANDLTETLLIWHTCCKVCDANKESLEQNLGTLI